MKASEIMNFVFKFEWDDVKYYVIPKDNKFVLAKKGNYLTNKLKWENTKSEYIEEYMKAKNVLKNINYFDSVIEAIEFIAGKNPSPFKILSGTEGYMIRKGKKTYLLEDGSRTSSVFKTREFDLKEYKPDKKSRTFESIEDFVNKTDKEIEDIFSKEKEVKIDPKTIVFSL